MTRNELFAVLKSNARTYIASARSKQIHETGNLRTLGATTIEAVQFVHSTMKQLKIRVPLDELNSTHNFKDLLDLFEQYVPANVLG